MESLLIDGGTRLKGDVRISGAKNAVLPIMAATLLTREKCTIKNVPELRDVNTMVRILRSLGAEVEFKRGTVTVKADKINGIGDYDLIRQMRGSICILGPLLGRLGKAKVSVPGGCVIGVRPIDLHLKGMRALGASIRTSQGYVHASATKLKGSEMFLGGRSGPTVLGTANVIMAATLSEGKTIIDSAACEPEVIDLCDFLKSMGAEISGVGSPTIRVNGVKKLKGATHTVIPDRIEAATFAIAAAATNGEVTIKNCRPDHLQAVIDKLWEAGVKIEKNGRNLTVKRGARLKPVDVTTQPYSGFPTDVQAQLMALMVRTPGISIITERIFEARFAHVPELGRLGADIAIEGPSAIVKGGSSLSGAPVMASDLRASAALVIAGLCASGTTQINRIYHLDRGYEKIDQKLEKLGGKVRRVNVQGP
ncbi:MAG: UDP-N-acetylglucosamine 1-carboxyvinyltransferase [Verrucomicrobiales bacterium]|nr:UDP-N-acetylglucosamine 1-carboxyvinyltransferase [Verrucomicrobiales bacterium]|tara:strand:+ start:14161 stop:15429 length:1269 start_codon:yes stop_codon:yes gene_type:complete